ncbi:apolipoprotein A1/A4/E family protein [Streptomyces abyssomicinicus]|uniref:apolipoprotein A1/A4/E family protein n=1 Tax=Streptomyces abyssomicinicus TaxID=574929 RepID=UPI0015816DE0|nr:apolipoprotein A1/A4/E family protein [Streptomyces abyssomicinicus]
MGVLHEKLVASHHLEDRAQDPALAPRREELRALARAMASHDESALDPWADLDLMANFARPESVARDVAPVEGRRARWLSKTVDGLDWFLGALVFLPLLFTWTGLAMATSAYGDLTAQSPKAAARPFLQLWQTGFEGHLHSWFEFGHVAVFGCVALLALLTLTLLHGNRRAAADRAEEKAEQDTRAALARLVPVLTEAQLILNAHRFASPVRFAEELNKAGGKIQRMHSKALTTQQQLTEAAAAVRESLEKAEERLARADEKIRPLEDAVTRMADTVRDSGTMIRTAVRELDQPLSRLGDELKGAVDGHREALDRSRDSLVTAGEELRDNVRAASGDLRDVLTGTVDRLEATVSGNGDDVRTALTDAAQRVEDSLTLLAATQRGFTTSVEVVGDLHSQLIDGLKAVAARTEQAAGDSRQAVSGIADRTRSLDQAAQRFTTVVDALDRAAKGGEAATAAAERARRRTEEAQAQARETLAEAEARAQEVLRQAEAHAREMLARAQEVLDRAASSASQASQASQAPPPSPASSAPTSSPASSASPTPAGSSPVPSPPQQRSEARPHPSSEPSYAQRQPVSLDKAS